MILHRPCAMLVLVSFIASFLIVPHRAYAADAVSSLPVPGAMVNLSPAFEPVLMKGIKVHPENPFEFDFIMDMGQTGLKANDAQLKVTSEKLIKYFLAAMTIPEKDLWVNLSPYEKDRIIADNLGETDMGRDMLAQDYILKQLTASLIYPEKELGKKFWDNVYAKAQKIYGSTQIPVNTFNKVWIVADQADVFERGNVAYVVGAHLKVMLEEDYLALNKNTAKSSHTVASQIIREIILPEIEKEVNTGKNFAPLRQIFYSMILASWYKMALKDTILNQIYGNKSKTGNLASSNLDNEAIYQRYLQAYKKGVFNYIKEDITVANQQPTPRKYFSGGVTVWANVRPNVLHTRGSSQGSYNPTVEVKVDLDPGKSKLSPAMSAVEIKLGSKLWPDFLKDQGKGIGVLEVDNEYVRIVMKDGSKVVTGWATKKMILDIMTQGTLKSQENVFNFVQGQLTIDAVKRTIPTNLISTSPVLRPMQIKNSKVMYTTRFQFKAEDGEYGIPTVKGKFWKGYLFVNGILLCVFDNKNYRFDFFDDQIYIIDRNGQIQEQVTIQNNEFSRIKKTQPEGLFFPNDKVNAAMNAVKSPPAITPLSILKRAIESKVSFSSVADMVAAEALYPYGWDSSKFKEWLGQILKARAKFKPLFSSSKIIAAERSALYWGIDLGQEDQIFKTLSNLREQKDWQAQEYLAAIAVLENSNFRDYKEIVGVAQRVFLAGLESRDPDKQYFKALLWDRRIAKTFSNEPGRIEELRKKYAWVLGETKTDAMLAYTILRLAAKKDIGEDQGFVYAAEQNAKDAISNQVSSADKVLYAAGLVEIGERPSEAMMTNSPKPTQGGIDLDRNKMTMNVSKDAAMGGVKGTFDPAILERIRRDGFDSLGFKVRSITAVNVPQLLGVK